MVDISLAINKNAHWDEPIGISRENLEKFDERETYLKGGNLTLLEYRGDKLMVSYWFFKSSMFLS